MLKKVFIVILLILGFIVRLYKIDSPIADWHSHRQADTAAVTQNLIKNFDLLHPRYYDLSDVQSGKYNPLGLRFVEFPIYNLFSFWLYQVGKLLFPSLTIEIACRLTSIFLSLATAIIIYLICQNLTQKYWPSLFALASFLFLPFSIYYSRAILPESTAAFFMVLTMLLFPKNILLSSISFALAILTKPYTGIILTPVLLFFVFSKSYLSTKKHLLSLVIFSLISLLPFFLWRQWLTQYPEGVPDSIWLLNAGNMRFRPAWFRWLFFERIGKLILGIYGVIPALLGFAYRKNQTQLFCFSQGFGILAYFSIIARGNIQHDYYQTLIIPFLSIVTGFGIYYLTLFVFKNFFLSIIVSVIISSFSLAYSFYQVKEYYKINNPSIIEAGQYVDKNLPSDAIIIAPYFGDTAFLYQTKRFGYPLEIYDIPKIKSLHPNQNIYLVSVNYDNYTNEKIKKYQTIYRSQSFIILDIDHEL